MLPTEYLLLKPWMGMIPEGKLLCVHHAVTVEAEGRHQPPDLGSGQPQPEDRPQLLTKRCGPHHPWGYIYVRTQTYIKTWHVCSKQSEEALVIHSTFVLSGTR